MLTIERALARGLHSQAVLAKGDRLYRLGAVRPDPEYPDVFWVRSGSGLEREYRVQLHQHFASCSCRHGIHAGSDAVCAHPIAAMHYRHENGLETVEDAIGRQQAEDCLPVTLVPTESLPGPAWEWPEGDLPEAPF